MAESFMHSHVVCSRVARPWYTVLALTAVLCAIVAGCSKDVPPPRELSPASQTTNPQSAPSTQSVRKDRQSLWLGRLGRDVRQIADDEGRASSGRIATLVTAESGQVDAALKLASELPENDRNQALVLLSGELSSDGKFGQALAVLDGVAGEGVRDAGLSLIVNGMASHGDINAALALMAKIKTTHNADRARRYVALAHARSGNMDATNKMVAEIADEDTRKSAAESIANLKAPNGPDLTGVKSEFVRTSISSLLLFDDPKAWRTSAFEALKAAGKCSPGELDSLVNKTIASLPKDDKLSEATAKLVLCVALGTAGRRDDAREMARCFLDTANGMIVNVPGAFGKPVLAYLFASLRMEEQLQELLVDKEGQFPTRPYCMHAVGAACADMGDWAELENRYAKLGPQDRAYLAMGVLSSLHD